MAQRGETEDGLGWGGLVASKAELREERRQAGRLRETPRATVFCARSTTSRSAPKQHATQRSTTQRLMLRWQRLVLVVLHNA